MRHVRLLLALGTAAGLGVTARVAAQTDRPSLHFAAPIRLKAGDKFLGENRLYPSPVFHDIDGDGRLDIVVGDLLGHLTVALRGPGERLAFGEETKLLDGDGKAIDFHNW